MHDAPHAESQQYVSTHDADATHPLAVVVVQCCPCLLLHIPVASQVPEQCPLGSALLTAPVQTWLVPHAWHEPGQSLSTQHPAIGMHVPLQAFVPELHA
jgi:hypothetical protein